MSQVNPKTPEPTISFEDNVVPYITEFVNNGNQTFLGTEKKVQTIVEYLIDEYGIGNETVAEWLDIRADETPWFDEDDYIQEVEVEVEIEGSVANPSNLSDEIRSNTVTEIYNNKKISQKDIDNFLKAYT